MKLEPWQADLLVKLEEGYSNGTEMVFMAAGRNVGKSTWYALHQQLMNKPTSRFVPYDLHHKLGLMIQDYMWWTENEREILNWMEANLPDGIDHQQGMTITFDSDKDRLMFMLRWS